MWPWKLQGLLRPRVGQKIPKYMSPLFQIIRISLVERIGPDPLVRLIPQNLLHRRTVVDYGAVGFDDGYAIRGVLHQGAEALLATTQLLGLLDLGDVRGNADDGHQVTLLIMHGGVGNQGRKSSAVLVAHHELPRPAPPAAKLVHDFFC